jgi:hypothetical protein
VVVNPPCIAVAMQLKGADGALSFFIKKGDAMPSSGKKDA